MGTSAAGSDLHSDRLAKLQARKRELEILLAAKNEELYKLCVQEVRLTGVMPPEVPVDAPTESPILDTEPDRRRGTVDDGVSGTPRLSHRRPSETGGDAGSPSRRRRSHRLSTQSISGVPVVRGELSGRPRKTESASADRALPAPDVRGIPSSWSYPVPPPRRPPGESISGAHSRHHTVTVERFDGFYHSSGPEASRFSRSRETHFSSSHPDVTVRVGRSMLGGGEPDHAPLLFQYASRLKAQSQHLSAASRPTHRMDSSRRNTLQRAQTYHLASRSDVVSLAGDVTAGFVRCPSEYDPRRLPPAPQSPRTPVGLTFPSMTNDRPEDAYDQKAKEKEWYESSLDSPSVPDPISPRRSGSLRRPPPRPPSPEAPARPLPRDVAYESPQNCTVVESGKWIPYREETKPFEMSDFYKYSVKFRQNGAPEPKPKMASPPGNTSSNFHPAEELHARSIRDARHRTHQL